MKYKRVAVDTSKSVFTIHAVDDQDRAVLRRDLRRGPFIAFLAALEPTELVFEACGASHHWGREAMKHDHAVRLIPPQYVKPFRKRGKNDRADAAALNDAASRPDMASVPVKSEACQAEAMLLKVRALLIRQRTQLVNTIRGHAAEFGLVAAKGRGHLPDLLALAAGSAIPVAAKEALALLGAEVKRLDEQVSGIERRLGRMHRDNETSRRLAEQPGIGIQTALSLALTIDAACFASGRHFAAWLGLTPREHSTGGKPLLGKISKQGNEMLRALLVNGAMAVIRHAKPGSRCASPWLLRLLERKPRKVAAVALANKMARIAWAMMARGEPYRHLPVAA